MMMRLIALTVLAFSSTAFADEGDIAIRCGGGGFSTLDRIEFRETDLEGQYQIIQVMTDGSERPAKIISSGYHATTNETEIRESAESGKASEFQLEYFWGNPTVLRMNGVENMIVVNQDPCGQTEVSLSCERI